MTNDRDPALQALFVEADEALPGEAFTAEVMVQADRLKRRAMITRVCVGLVLVVCAWLLAMPLQDGIALATGGLMTPLFDLQNPLLAHFLLPLNSVACLVALGLLGLRTVHRRLFS